MPVNNQKIFKHQCVPLSLIELCYLHFIAESPTVGFDFNYVDVFNLLKLPRAPPPLYLHMILLSIPYVG